MLTFLITFLGNGQEEDHTMQILWADIQPGTDTETALDLGP